MDKMIALDYLFLPDFLDGQSLYGKFFADAGFSGWSFYVYDESADDEVLIEKCTSRSETIPPENKNETSQV